MRRLLKCVSAAQKKRRRARQARDAQLPATAPFASAASAGANSGDEGLLGEEDVNVNGLGASQPVPNDQGGNAAEVHAHAEAGAPQAAPAAHAPGAAAACSLSDFAGAGHEGLFRRIKRRKHHHVVLRSDAWPELEPGVPATENTRAWADTGARGHASLRATLSRV